MTAAEQRVRETIIKHGPIRFDTLMTLALYEPEIGYYQTHMPGQDSDYQTSPTLTPWFGRLIARRLEQMWQQIESPDRFDVIEIGAGNAALAESAMDSLDGAFREALRWTFVEPFDPIRSAQVERMGADGTWVLTLEEIEPSTGCLLANEVLDNFPVRSFEIGIDTTFEIYIGLDDDRLVEILEPCDVARPELEVGDRFEINDHVDDWCKRAAAAIQRGFMLVIDYGDEEPTLFTRRPAGTIVTYNQGQLGVDPLVGLGEADITSHVNFSALSRAAASYGFTKAKITTQRELLKDLGIDDVMRDIASDTFAGLAERSRLAAIAAQGGLGDLIVFEAQKRLT